LEIYTTNFRACRPYRPHLLKTATGDGDDEGLCDVVNTVDADRAAVRILTRLGPEVVRLLLGKHHSEAAGFCAGCGTPTRWPCDLARLCQVAQDIDVPSVGKAASQ
jgi:hypothetical protein